MSVRPALSLIKVVYLEVLSYAMKNMHGNLFCTEYFMNRILLCNVIFVSALKNHCCETTAGYVNFIYILVFVYHRTGKRRIELKQHILIFLLLFILHTNLFNYEINHLTNRYKMRNIKDCVFMRRMNFRMVKVAIKFPH